MKLFFVMNFQKKEFHIKADRFSRFMTEFFDEGLRLNVLVDDFVICEFKAVEIINPVWQVQIISHLRLTQRRPGFIINFNVVLIKDGMRRYINLL